MIVYFAKSLDRPLEIVGLKGKWLTVFIALAGASVLIAIVAGVATTSSVGISAAILLIVVSFLLVLSLQGKTSSRQIAQQKASVKIYPYVRWNECLTRILLPDLMAERRKEPCEGLSCKVDGKTRELCSWCSYKKIEVPVKEEEK